MTYAAIALAALAALLLAKLLWQLARLRSVRDSLAAARERFALAVAGCNDGIWDWDLKNGRIFVSARGRELIGLPPGPEVMPSEEWFPNLRVHPDDIARRTEALEAHLAGKTPYYDVEYRIRHLDGIYRWIHIRGLCVRDAEGRPARMAGSTSDVDARKRAEEALRQSEERYAIAMTGSQEAHWVWDIATDEIHASPLLNEMLEIAATRRLTKRNEYLEQMPIHPEDREIPHQAMQDHLAGLTPRLDVEYRLIARDTGEIRWVHTRATCFRDAAGAPLRVAGATIDVSERKRAEERLRESEQRFARAVAGTNDGIIDWDIVNDRMYVSERTKRILGEGAGACVMQRAECLSRVEVHPEDLDRLERAFHYDPVGGTNGYEVDFRARHADGGYRWVRMRGKHVLDSGGQAVRWAGSLTDIDAEKRTQQALRESEERFQLAMDGVNQGVWDWDLASDTVYMSDRGQRLFGLEPGEPRRPRRDWISLWRYHADDRARVRAAVSAYLHGEARTFTVEYRMCLPSGEWHWFYDRGVALRDDSGRPYRMAGSVEDITERKNAQAERDRLEVQLRQAQKLEAIGTLAGGVAHDFNNILAAILGYGDMAQKAAPEGTSLRRYIDAAMSAGLRAKALVERILAFSRSGMGERAPVAVEPTVAEVLDNVAASLPQSVRLERRLAAGRAAVLADPAQLHQIVLNLCTNAAQAIDSAGTVSVALEVVELSAERSVSTMTLQAGRYVKVQVADSGNGIDPQIIDRIFDPFFTTKELGTGTGLGLSLVHGIVSDLGGGIDVHSAPGVGSTFDVYLPWHGLAPRSQVCEEPIVNGAGETVLLVDDETALVRLGEEMMAEIGYEPVGFTSSLAALESFRAEPERFDAVLTDEAMPSMSGSELAIEIRKLRPDIPIVLMSGYPTPALTARARAAGFEVLAKPLVARDIARSLAGALRT
jgi:PAS domain S-box-containing protein